MNPKAKKYFLPAMILMVLMFVWILVAVLLTGGREVGAFTDADKKIMTVFAIVEVITVVSMFLLACKAGKINRANHSQMPKTPKTKTEKTIRTRNIVLLVFSMVLAYGLVILGITLGKNMPEETRLVFSGIFLGSFLLAGLLFMINSLLYKRQTRRFENQKVRQLQQFILSHREMAEQTAEEKYAFVKRWKQLTDLYAVGILILGMAMSFCAGASSYRTWSTTFFLASGWMISAAVSRIRMDTPESVFEDDKTFIREEDYPKLYTIAQRAADISGCRGKIRICLMGNSNAGIGKVGEHYVLQIGMILLKTLSEEELYHVLLHEFSHMVQEQARAHKERRYFNWLMSGGNDYFGSRITDRLFLYFDGRYVLEFGLYLYAATIQIETTADQAMVQLGDAETAGSALRKIRYYDLFCWEKGGRDEENLYVEEKPDKQVLTREIQAFLTALPLQQERWNDLIQKEILSRNASHPTLKMRLDSLGVPEGQTLAADHGEEYAAELEKALAYVEELVYENRSQNYEKERQVYYLEPMEKVEDWEAAGKPLVAEEYGDLVWYLRQLGRSQEALELCQRAIENLSPIASSQARFIRGIYRLYCYNEAGLEDVYFAIEQNKNYMEDGLAVIGEFCCLTGNQAELDCYREKAMDLAQEDKDMYSQISTLQKQDRLSGETLPEGMLEGILGYIRSIEGGQIQTMYLVRKTITEDFFTSALVVKFCADAQEDATDEIMHKIFRYLDTSTDWQFSLFDYRDVASVKVERIENSCIYEKEA